MDGDWLDGDAQQPRPSGRLTTMIPRPASRRASDAGRSRLGDIRRRRRGDGDRISSRRSRWLFVLAAFVIAGAIGAALFGLPVRTWFSQDDQIRALEHELDEMEAVNDDLAREVERLQTDDGIREAARDELGQILAGDLRQTVGQLPALPRDLPAGWPYTQVDQIMTMRAHEASTTLAPPPSSTAAAVATTSAAPTAPTPTTVPPTTTTVPAPQG